MACHNCPRFYIILSRINELSFNFFNPAIVTIWKSGRYLFISLSITYSSDFRN